MPAAESVAATAPDVRLASQVLSLRDPAIFGPEAHARARLFARRALAVDGVLSLAIQPEDGSARIRYRAEPGQRKAWLERLARAVGMEDGALADPLLPDWQPYMAVRLLRCRGQVISLDIDTQRPDRLELRHACLAGSANPLSLRLGQALGRLAGVRAVTIDDAAGLLRVHYSPARVTAERLLRVVETVCCEHDPIAAVADPAHVPMGTANASVGLGALGELLLPVATPVAAGILVTTHLGVVRDAATQLGRGKVGVPLFHTALLTCSIVTGQVLAFALTDWSLRYWQRRWRRQLADETRSLVEVAGPVAEGAGLPGGRAGEGSAPPAIRPGQAVRVVAGAVVPADGQVGAGMALVDEGWMTGAATALRKLPGDAVLAGSRVLAGSLEMVAERVGTDTRAARIGAAMAGAAAVIPASAALRARSEQLADRTALPTLATAGVGWLAGDLITVGAILHQDWISGPALAVPLLTLRQMRAMRVAGALVQNPSAIARLAECDFVVLDGDDPRLADTRPVLTGIRSRLPDSDALLCQAAGAALYLGGDWAVVLAEACRARNLVVRQPELLALAADGVRVRQGERELALCIRRGADEWPTLRVTVDGQDVAELRFGPAPAPLLADTVRRLQALGLPVFLLSSAPEARTGELAASLGIELHGGNLDLSGRMRFLEGLRRRGVKPLLAGRLREQAGLASLAHATVATDTLAAGPMPADVVALDGSCCRLADWLALARAHDADIIRNTRLASIPNLLCIAGGFGGVLNGITSGIVANIGVLNVDRGLRRTLADRPDMARGRAIPHFPASA